MILTSVNLVQGGWIFSFFFFFFSRILLISYYFNLIDFVCSIVKFSIFANHLWVFSVPPFHPIYLFHLELIQEKSIFSIYGHFLKSKSLPTAYIFYVSESTRTNHEACFDTWYECLSALSLSKLEFHMDSGNNMCFKNSSHLYFIYEFVIFFMCLWLCHYQRLKTYECELHQLSCNIMCFKWLVIFMI